MRFIDVFAAKPEVLAAVAKKLSAVRASMTPEEQEVLDKIINRPAESEVQLHAAKPDMAADPNWAADPGWFTSGKAGVEPPSRV